MAALLRKGDPEASLYVAIACLIGEDNVERARQPLHLCNVWRMMGNACQDEDYLTQAMQEAYCPDGGDSTSLRNRTMICSPTGQG